MLAEGTDGNTKEQLDAIIGDYKAKKYNNNEHMSFANAMFIRNSFKDAVLPDYITNLQNKYNAEVRIEQFNSTAPMNNWVKEKTFNLIDSMVDEDTLKEEQFILVNALAIDMYWKNQIHCASGIDKNKVPCYNGGVYHVTYRHEKLKGEEREYSATSYPYTSEGAYPSLTFNGTENIKSASVIASINNAIIEQTIIFLLFIRIPPFNCYNLYLMSL